MNPRLYLIISLLFATMLAGCAPQMVSQVPDPPEVSKLSGAVVYRERIVLPADAIVEVWLTDVSAGPQAPLAVTSFRSEGRQVPLMYELVYDAEQIRPDRDYVVQALIRAEGLVFQTEEVVPVLTKGHSHEAGIWLVRVVEQAVVPVNFLGSRWKLVSIGDVAVLPDVEASLEFAEAGRVTGSGSCNRFSGPVELTGDAIRFGPLISTLMACAEPIMRQEQSYLRALEQVERFVLSEEELLIYRADVALRFQPWTTQQK